MTISIDIEKACEKIRLPFIYVKRKKNIHPHKDLYTNVNRSFIYNSPNWKQLRMFNNR